MGKLIPNRWKLIIKSTDVIMYANEQLRLCFHVLVRYFVVLDIHL